MKKRNYVAASEQKLTTPEIAERPNSREKKQKTEKLELTCSTTGLIRQID